MNDSNFHHNAFGVLAPGLIIILLDQSSNMRYKSKFGLSTSELASNLVNQIIEDLIAKFVLFDEIHNGCFVSVISYGPLNDCQVLISKWIRDIGLCPIEEREEEYNVMDKDGKKIAISVNRPRWIIPISEGQCCMGAAFDLAFEISDAWCKDFTFTNIYNEEGYLEQLGRPLPIIVNITSGEFVDEDALISSSERIKSIVTEDGSPLIINIVLKSGSYALSLPSKDAGLSIKEKILYRISSEYPKSYKRVETNRRNDVEEESRLYISTYTNIKPVLEIIDIATQTYDFAFNTVVNPYVGFVDQINAELILRVPEYAIKNNRKYE